MKVRAVHTSIPFVHNAERERERASFIPKDERAKEGIDGPRSIPDDDDDWT